MNQKAKKTFKIVINVLLWIFLVLALVMTVLAFSAQASSNGYPTLGNNCFLTVESDSMNGPNGFKKGDLIICRVLSDEEKQNLKIDDVVTFYADLNGDGIKEMNTHRIVSGPDSVDGVLTFQTQGDNRKVSPVSETTSVEDIEAIWTGKRIAVLGDVISFLRSSTGFLICIVLPLAAFFVYELVIMINTINKIRNKNKRQITREEEELIKQRAVEEYLARQQQANADDDGSGSSDSSDL